MRNVVTMKEAANTPRSVVQATDRGLMGVALLRAVIIMRL
jgi:hypothetical protein